MDFCTANEGLRVSIFFWILFSVFDLSGLYINVYAYLTWIDFYYASLETILGEICHVLLCSTKPDFVYFKFPRKTMPFEGGPFLVDKAADLVRFKPQPASIFINQILVNLP